MADISKCRGDGNVICEKCYRKLAIAYTYQSYIIGHVNLGVCQDYWPLRKARKRKTLVKKGNKYKDKKFSKADFGEFVNQFREDRVFKYAKKS